MTRSLVAPLATAVMVAAILAAPRSAQTTELVDVSELSSAGPTGEPSAPSAGASPAPPRSFAPGRGTEQPRTPTPSAAPTDPLERVTYDGRASWVRASLGDRYLALREPRGTVATICGPGSCITRRSTDVGPDRRIHPDRVADLSARDFPTVCGVPRSLGLCPVTVTIERRPAP